MGVSSLEQLLQEALKETDFLQGFLQEKVTREILHFDWL